MPIFIHRVYSLATAPEGQRYLVDRLWPRGIKKEQLTSTVWLKDVAPSNELRHWYQHEPEKWPEFQQRYFAELDFVPDAWAPLADAARHHSIVLLYSSKETKINNAAALKIYLESKLKQ